MKKVFLFFVFVIAIPVLIFSQTKEERKIITKNYNQKILSELAKSLDKKAKLKKEKALMLAKKYGWVIRDDDGKHVKELMSVSKEGTPIYYTTYSANAAISTRANTLHSGGIMGLNLNGDDIVAYIWDDGCARVTHQEYDGAGGNNRYSEGEVSGLQYHSAHVTGIIISSGVDPDAKGMAWQADAVGYNYDNDVAEATTEAANGMLVSNHSYGWDDNDFPDWRYGAYHELSHDWDEVMYNAPYYLMMVAGGNFGDDNTINGDPLEGNSTYDKLSGHRCSKNNLVVANAQDANINANGDLISVTINPESSQGPTDDYRIKPDIAGNGTEVYSTYQNADDQYGTTSGTSMATPSVTGTLMLLQEHYHNLNGQYMLAASLKGLALHTADDAGTAGPDAIWGWGLLNGKEAANVISNNGDESRLTELSLSEGESYSVNVESDGVNDLVVSISWTDPPGTINTGTSNDNTPVLVNDLDLRVSNGTTYFPYKLTSVTTNSTGDNIVDPYEKIVINGASGSYTITVSHKGNLSGGSQNFTLIVTGEEGVPAAPVANFYADETNPETGQTVSFYDVSLKAPTSWAWSFSPSTITYVGGTSSTSKNPKVTFDAADSYTVTLVATNNLGSDTEEKIDYIIASEPTCSYCLSTYSNTTDDWINQVTFNSIDNSSGQGGSDSYEDFTSLSTNIVRGNTYPINVSIQINDGSTEHVFVWVDWDKDCVFDVNNEYFDLGDINSTGTVTGNITVPTGATLGSTTMRIIEQYDDDPTPCNPHPQVYGETEDYSVNIVSCQTVFNTRDSGEGSIRYAIECAEDGDTVFLSSSINDSTIIITSTSLEIDKNIFIIANPEDSIIVSSVIPQTVDVETIFNINPGKVVKFENFSIKGGYGPNGSAIRNQGDLLLDNVPILNGGMTGLNSVIENQAGAILKIENSVDME